jgi:integrase
MPSHDDAAQKPSSAPLPGWLRQAYAPLLDAACADVAREAKRGMKGDGENDAGLIADRRIKAILTLAGSRDPTDSTVAAYRCDHANMLLAGTTPIEKATTFQHWNRLRSAWKFGEIEAIKALRGQAESARRLKDYGRMRVATLAAFERAALLEAMFLSSTLAPSRQTWGRKAAALRAAGSGFKAGKSKRAAGRVAPSPDELLILLSRQRLRCVRVEVAAAVFACFGVRPAELLTGARLYIEGDALGLEVWGAKVDAKRGQPRRRLLIAPTRLGCSGLALALLKGEVDAGRTRIRVTAADLVAVRRAMRAAQSGLSPYAFRHARASDAKASHGAMGAAAWLGHATDRAQSGYGHGRSSNGTVRVKNAQTSRAVRGVKSLPSDSARPTPTCVLADSFILAEMPDSVPARPAKKRRKLPAF